MRTRDLVIYLFLAIVWGFSFLAVMKASAAFGWVGAVFFRAIVAAATLAMLALATRRRLDFSMGWQPLTVVGATTVAGQLVGISYATPRIGTAMAAIIVAAIPLFSMLIGLIAGVERLGNREAAGLVIGLGGIVLLVGFPSAPVTPDFLIGCVAALGGSLSAATGSVYAGHRLRTASPFAVTTGAFVAGAGVTAPLLLAVPVPGVPGLSDYAALLVLGALMSATTYVLYFKLVASIGPTRAISVEFAVTVVAVAVGALLLDERLTATQIAGAMVIALGCTMVLGLLPSRGGRKASTGGA